MFSSPVVPALIPSSARDISDFTTTLLGVPEIHVDVVDGKFVPFVSWPYDPEGTPKEVEQICRPFTLEVDLMVKDPLKAAESWLKAGADMLVFHIETVSAVSLRAFCETTNVTVGVSLLNDTDVSDLTDYLPFVDYVQIMGIKEIGAQGQPFDNRAIERISTLRSQYPDLAISLDGSVNEETSVFLFPLNLNRYIMGSAITKATDPLAAYKHYSNLFSSTGRQ